MCDFNSVQKNDVWKYISKALHDIVYRGGSWNIYNG